MFQIPLVNLLKYIACKEDGGDWNNVLQHPVSCFHPVAEQAESYPGASVVLQDKFCHQFEDNYLKTLRHLPSCSITHDCNPVLML